MEKRKGDQNLGKLNKPGKKTAKRREWRGFKDTMYDFSRWLHNLLVMSKFIMKPTTIKAMFTYRWFGNYLAAFDYIDRHVEGVRGEQLRIAHIEYDSIVEHLTQTMDTLFKCDKRIGNKHGKYDELNKKLVIMDENGMMVIATGFPNLKFLSKEVPAIYTGSTISQTGVMHYIEVAEEFQIPGDVCPMPCAELGCSIDEDYPICGVCAIHCNTTCDGSLMGNQIEDRHDDLPSFTMAAPMRHQQKSVLAYSRDQIVEAIHFIEKHTGEKWDWDAFSKNMKTYNAQNALFEEWMEMNKTNYPQVVNNNVMLYRDAEYMVISGRDASFLKYDQKITQLAKEGYKNHVLPCKETRHRALVWGVHAQYYTAFNQWLSNCWGIVCLCDMLSFTLTKPIHYE
ncbi:MAG TPA: 2-hydroxyacyl-CoA dehydratase, partial [Firmicutes bacterium]|nr:2-hydroxyacyl-CoA dehydratase [Bacillota bacterium]